MHPWINLRVLAEGLSRRNYTVNSTPFNVCAIAPMVCPRLAYYLAHLASDLVHVFVTQSMDNTSSAALAHSLQGCSFRSCTNI